MTKAEAVTTALEHVSTQQARLGKQREGDYWKAQLRKAAEQEGEGAFMTAVYGERPIPRWCCI